MSSSFTWYESALRFILFIILPSVIRVWILSPKNSSVIFSKSTVFMICLWILWALARLCFLLIWSIIEKIVSSILFLAICYKRYLLVWKMIVVLAAFKCDDSKKVNAWRLIVLPLLQRKTPSDAPGQFFLFIVLVFFFSKI